MNANRSRRCRRSTAIAVLSVMLTGCGAMYYSPKSAKSLYAVKDRATAMAERGDWQGAQRLLASGAASGHPFMLLSYGRLLLSSENPARDPVSGRAALVSASAKSSAWSDKIAYELGSALAKGEGGDKDPVQARALLERAVAADVPMAAIDLARLLAVSDDADDRRRAEDIFRAGAQRGDARAQAWLVDRDHENGSRPDAFVAFAARNLEANLSGKAKNGDRAATRELANRYANGSLGLARPDQARRLWERLAAEGDTAAMRRLADDATRRNDAVGRERWLEVLADHGDMAAMLKLADGAESAGRYGAALAWVDRAGAAGATGSAGRIVRLAARHGNLDRARDALDGAVRERDTAALTALARARKDAGDKAGAIAVTKLAAGLGDKNAVTELGIAHLEGDGVPRDELLARRYLEPAVAAGQPLAMVNLARLLIDRDHQPTRAEALLRRAVDAGSRLARFELGRRKLEGLGLHRDTAVAIELLSSASGDGDVPAAYLLGKAYLDGKLLPRDPGKADLHLRRAQAGGSKGAVRLLAKL